MSAVAVGMCPGSEGIRAHDLPIGRGSLMKVEHGQVVKKDRQEVRPFHGGHERVQENTNTLISGPVLHGGARWAAIRASRSDCTGAMP